MSITDSSRWLAVLSGALLCTLAAGAASAAPVDRKLTINITVDGKQDWKNALQWSKGTTTQSYDFSTTLRSDGRLFAPNLLDPDTQTRLAIKTEYLRQQGMAKLKAMGVDPKSPDLMRELSTKAQKANFECKGDSVCMANTGTAFAELMAAAVEPDNSQLFEGPPRYQYFFGYPGCQNTIRSVHKYQAAGETAYGRNKDKIFPFALSYDGDYTGSEQEKTSMCTFYTVTVDTVEDKLYVENTHIPDSRGKIVRTEFEKTSTTEDELPVLGPLQGWVNENLRQTTFSGNAEAALPLPLPLDGNATVLGLWTGEAKTTLKWAWTDLAGKPVGPAPAAAPAAAAKPAAKAPPAKK